MRKEVIQIKDLSYSYPDGTKVLEGINLDVQEGQTLGIIGPNGAGKTTLLLHLNGLLNGDGNDISRVKIVGLDVEKKNLKAIRKAVGFVFQEPEDQLFMPTVYEDVSFGPSNLGWDKQRVERESLRALQAVDMADKSGHLSHHLSLGEKKRVAVATVLSMSPDILVLDEPSANLDPAARRHLIGLLKFLSVTKIIASHDMELVLELAERVVVLDCGRIAADGNPQDILGDDLLMRQHNLEVPLTLKYSPGNELIKY